MSHFHRLPKDARRRPDAKPWQECKKAVNKLYYGDENIDAPPGKDSMFRGVVVVGCVLAERTVGGELVASTGGAYTFDPQEPGYALALAAQLRAMADALEREAGS
jgi:hypothetical protein